MKNYILGGTLPVSMPSVHQSIMFITENKALTTYAKIKALTSLYFSGGPAARSMKDTARIMLAIEILATKEITG